MLVAVLTAFQYLPIERSTMTSRLFKIDEESSHLTLCRLEKRNFPFLTMSVWVVRCGRTLHLLASSATPVAIMAAFQYLPTEEHYDVATVGQWLRREVSASLTLPLSKMRTHPCTPKDVVTS